MNWIYGTCVVVATLSFMSLVGHVGKIATAWAFWISHTLANDPAYQAVEEAEDRAA